MSWFKRKSDKPKNSATEDQLGNTFSPDFVHKNAFTRLELDTKNKKILLKDLRVAKVYNFSEVHDISAQQDGPKWTMSITVNDIACPVRYITFWTQLSCNTWMSRLRVALDMQII